MGQYRQNGIRPVDLIQNQVYRLRCSGMEAFAVKHADGLLIYSFEIRGIISEHVVSTPN